MSSNPENKSQKRLDSPCVRLCTLNDLDVCVGCGRTLEEIRSWSVSTIDVQKTIAATAVDRLAELSVGVIGR